jgi:hypothetical protein
MTFTNFILFCFATIGLTNIIVHGKVLDEIKVCGRTVRGWLYKWHFTKELSSCYECSGFWAGMICGAAFVWPNWWLIPIAGFAGSMLGKTYTDFMFFLESKTDFEVGNGEETGH